MPAPGIPDASLPDDYAPGGLQSIGSGFGAGTNYEATQRPGAGLPSAFEDQQWGDATTGRDYWTDYFRQGLESAPVQVGYDTANQDQARSWQTQFMQDLQRSAAGDPNSRAQQSLALGYQQAGQQQQALGSAMRGTGGAAGLRAGARGAGDVQRGFAGNQQMLMAQEQQGAQAALAQMLAQQRAQDQQQAGAMAQNQLGNTALDDDMRNFLAQQAVGSGINADQQNFDFTRALLGMGLEATDIGMRNAQQAQQALAGGIGAASMAWGGGANNSGGWRQVDGQNSIVPEWDK